VLFPLFRLSVRNRACVRAWLPHVRGVISRYLHTLLLTPSVRCVASTVRKTRCRRATRVGAASVAPACRRAHVTMAMLRRGTAGGMMYRYQTWSTYGLAWMDRRRVAMRDCRLPWSTDRKRAKTASRLPAWPRDTRRSTRFASQYVHGSSTVSREAAASRPAIISSERFSDRRGSKLEKPPLEVVPTNVWLVLPVMGS